MFTEEMNASIKANQAFADSLSDHELDELFNEFNDYEVEEFSDWFNNSKVNCDYLYSFKIFEYFEKEHKPVNLDQDILIKKDPKKVLFLF